MADVPTASGRDDADRMDDLPPDLQAGFVQRLRRIQLELSPHSLGEDVFAVELMACSRREPP